MTDLTLDTGQETIVNLQTALRKNQRAKKKSLQENHSEKKPKSKKEFTTKETHSTATASSFL